jgi:DNA-binding beta-propeller fold protein YncE
VAVLIAVFSGGRMRRYLSVLVTLAPVLLASALVVQIRAADPNYKLIKEIPVGGEGGWDYLNIDSAAKRLYVSHGTKAVVVDLAKDAVVGEIEDTPGIHGAIAVPPDRVFTSNGRGDNASVVDAKSLKTIKKVTTEGNPDFIMYEPKQKEVYTFNGRGRSASVISVASGDVVATIPLGGKPEAGVADSAAGRVYVNIEDKSTVAVIDVATHMVVATWPIAPAEEASGLAIDTRNHRLFIGAHNKLMAMMDSTNGKVVAQVPIGQAVDATWFDPGTALAFSSCGDGTVTIAHEDAPDKLTVVQTLKTEQGARTMALDPATHRIYLASAKFGPAPSGGGRASMLPDSFKILVYGMDGK